jgi:thymidylate synthase
MLTNKTNRLWQRKVKEILYYPNFTAAPRGMEVREILNGSYILPMPAYINLIDRKINTQFMFAEAAWIISGSNLLSQITPYMKTYANFSDDGTFLRGAYGPKVVDQLGYVVDTLMEDKDSRQAVISIWRERPAKSKDIPCTVIMQFIIRNGKLYMITTMRSHDIILGFTYDVFTFSMVAKAVQLLLLERGLNVALGDLYVNAGSMHLYNNFYGRAELWLKSTATDKNITKLVNEIESVNTYEGLLSKLRSLSNRIQV